MTPTPPHMEIYSWNPPRPIFSWPLRVLLPFKKPVNNFGDLLGPLIVGRMLAKLNLDEKNPRESRRFLTVGSVLRLADDGDVIWGTGINGKPSTLPWKAKNLRICAVRGPRTAEFLRDKGFEVPAVYGDPALLLPTLFPELLEASLVKKYPVAIVPNLNDLKQYARSKDLINPTANLWEVLTRIVQSELVVGSSLHGIIVAEAFGIPARTIISSHENSLKYLDYYEGSGRYATKMAETVSEAISLGGESPLDWKADPLLEAFPSDLWWPRKADA